MPSAWIGLTLKNPCGWYRASTSWEAPAGHGDKGLEIVDEPFELILHRGTPLAWGAEIPREGFTNRARVLRRLLGRGGRCGRASYGVWGDSRPRQGICLNGC